MGMVMVKEKKHAVQSKDSLLQIIGLVEARKSDVTKDHNRILYGKLRKGTIKRIDTARKRMKKSYVPHEKVMREFLS